jgi:hypothetical protein
VGSNNNLGRTLEADAEYRERNAATMVWLQQAFALAKRPEHKALMLIMQANPRFEDRWPPTSDLDSDSYGYRYPIDTKGEHSAKKNQRVNLESFATHMSAVLDELDTIHFALSGETYIAQDALYETIRSSL